MDMDVRKWDAYAGEWVTVTVDAPPEPRQADRRTLRRPGQPVDLAALSAGSPLPSWWRDTAFAPEGSGGLADMRTNLKDETVRTHRGPVVSWSAFDDLPSDRSEWTRQDYDVAGTARHIFTTIAKGK
jgi:hypothetical protein